MVKRNAYEAARRKFDFHLAQDAIARWLADNPHVTEYLEDIEARGEELDGYQDGDEAEAWVDEADKMEAWTDEAEGVASVLVDEVRRATGDTFTGTRYNALVEAARDRLNINW